MSIAKSLLNNRLKFRNLTRFYEYIWYPLANKVTYSYGDDGLGFPTTYLVDSELHMTNKSTW